MRSILMSLSIVAVSSAAFAGSASYMEVSAPASGVSCQVVSVGSTASLNTKDYSYDMQKDLQVFDGVRTHKMSIAIFDNNDQAIDINMSLDGIETRVKGVKVPKAGPSTFNPQDTSKTMALDVFESSQIKLYCVSK